MRTFEVSLSDHAVVVVRGPRLRVLPLADVAGAVQTSHGKLGKRFAVLDLTMKDGTHQHLTATKGWADAVEARIAAVH